MGRDGGVRVVVPRTCVRLRNDASLRKIRRALGTLREGLKERDHLSSYTLVPDGSSIYLVAPARGRACPQSGVYRAGAVVRHVRIGSPGRASPFRHAKQERPAGTRASACHLRYIIGVSEMA